MRTAITGASGFIGRALRAELAARGPVRALFRARTAASALWEASGHEAVLGDLSDNAVLSALVAGADVVYHCAARMAKDDQAASWDVNVRGTERLSRAAGAAGVSRLVYVSSISVYAASRRSDNTFTEDVEPENLHRLNAYGYTKYQGELVVRELAARGGPVFTIVRPTNVYGPWSGPWFLGFARMLTRVPVAVGDVPIDVVHVDDVVRALIQAGESPGAAGETIHVGHETVTLRDFIALVGDVVSRRARRLPDPVDSVVRVLVDRLYRLATGKCMSMSLVRPAIYPHTKAQRTIGYAPQVRLRDGFARLAEWYSNEYLPQVAR
jgi:nucleoside-diphosphate-sugar epimerase